METKILSKELRHTPAAFPIIAPLTMVPMSFVVFSGSFPTGTYSGNTCLAEKQVIKLRATVHSGMMNRYK